MQTVLQVNKSSSVINVLQHAHIYTVSLNLPRMLLSQDTMSELGMKSCLSENLFQQHPHPLPCLKKQTNKITV